MPVIGLVVAIIPILAVLMVTAVVKTLLLPVSDVRMLLNRNAARARDYLRASAAAGARPRVAALTAAAAARLSAEGDGADVPHRARQAREQPGQRDAADRRHGDGGHADDDPRDRALARQRVARHQARDQRREELRHEVVAHQQQLNDRLPSVEGEADADQGERGHRRLREPPDRGIRRSRPEATAHGR